MAEAVIETETKPVLLPNDLFVPEGYELTVIGAERSTDVKSLCESCGAPVGFFWAECAHCATPKSYLRYIKEGELAGESISGLGVGKTIVSIHELKGEVNSEAVSIGDESKVGSIKAKTANLGVSAKVGSITSLTTETDKGCQIQEIYSVHLSSSKENVLDQVTIMNHGSVFLGRGSRVKTLRLGEGVNFPQPHRSVRIEHVEHGSYDLPHFLKEP
jgi:hypothetical protein